MPNMLEMFGFFVFVKLISWKKHVNNAGASLRQNISIKNSVLKTALVNGGGIEQKKNNKTK